MIEPDIVELLTLSQVAAMLNLKRETVRVLARRGEIGSVLPTPRQRFFTRQQVADFITSRTIAVPKRLDCRPQIPAPSRIPKNRSLITEDAESRSDLRKELNSLVR